MRLVLPACVASMMNVQAAESVDAELKLGAVNLNCRIFYWRQSHRFITGRFSG